MKLIACLTGLLFAASAIADNHDEPYGGMNLSEGNALQMQLCALQPRKSMADRDRVMNAYLDWAEENDVEVFVVQATPLFGGPNVDSGFQFQWFDMLGSPYATSGAAWDKWLNTPEGQRINEQWLETANCRTSLNTIFTMFLDRERMSGDSRVMTMNWCTRKEGVSWDQLNAEHRARLAARPDDSPAAAWSIMYPGLGIRNPIGEFAHIVSYASVSDLMAAENALANEEGWRSRDDYYTSYADCIGTNVYQLKVLNRP